VGVARWQIGLRAIQQILPAEGAVVTSTLAGSSNSNARRPHPQFNRAAVTVPRGSRSRHLHPHYQSMNTGKNLH
jgi:hypothetical protein